LWAFAIGSALAAVADILIAFDTDMRPTMSFSWLLYGVVAMIIGGRGCNCGWSVVNYSWQPHNTWRLTTSAVNGRMPFPVRQMAA
jgi:ABC-type branched-subunit amino acid transport system permease subunit